MSIHIGAQPGEIAPSVLLPGDPLRARYIAEEFLQDAVCFNRVRGMLGFTGTSGGRRVSVMGTGMGIPSHSIYVHELIREYGVQTLVRVGTCGAMQQEMELGDLVIAMSACTDSSVNRLRFAGMEFAPTACFSLLRSAVDGAEAAGLRLHVGSVFTSDTFYDEDPEAWSRWASYGVLAVEMETTALYTLAAKFGVRAVSILTVSDQLVTGARASADQRERSFGAMVELALQIVPEEKG